MKRVKSVLMLFLFPVILLWGCNGEEPQERDNINIRQEQSSSGESAALPSQEQDIAAAKPFVWGDLLEESSWRDNTLDNYTAVMHLPLLPQQTEGEIGGIWEYALGSTCGAVYKKHFFDTAEDNWEEFKTVTEQGEEDSVRLAFREGIGNQIWGIGSIIGSDHFIMQDMEAAGDTDSAWKYRLWETDEDQRIVRTVELDFLSEDGEVAPGQIMVDRVGNIHFTTVYRGFSPEGASAGHRDYYCIADPEGALLAKYDYTDSEVRLVALYDGRVGLCSRLADDTGRGICSRLETADIEAGEMELLAELDRNAPKAFLNGAYYTLWDEKTLLYADNRGLHFADLSGNPAGDVYLWVNHGISFGELEELRIREDGGISLIYSDSQMNGNLLFLKPTQEKVEVQQIVFAVDSNMRDVYYPAVVEFNKRYPAYHIALKTDYDQTRLLTELTAGKGPVLVDTMHIDFADQEKLWAPLDGLFDGEEWEDILIPQAMDMGKIDGTMYGVVCNFGIKTVVIAGNEPTDWDYERFLSGIEENQSIEAICNWNQNAWSFMYYFLIHGMGDNYILDTENGQVSFNSDRFRRALRLGMTYCDIDKYVEAGMPGLEEKVFCNTITVTRPELIDLYRICYGEDANYIGYPSRNGSAHYIDSNCLLAVRATASDEEKKIAGAFLRILLSGEGQREGMKDSNFWLSVRRDALEEQISQVNERSMPHTYGFDQITLGDDYDREYDARLLEELLENARPEEHFPRELDAIFMEEIEEYSAGIITEEVLIERLAGRVELYLAEQE